MKKKEENDEDDDEAIADKRNKDWWRLEKSHMGRKNFS